MIFGVHMPLPIHVRSLIPTEQEGRGLNGTTVHCLYETSPRILRQGPYDTTPTPREFEKAAHYCLTVVDSHRPGKEVKSWAPMPVIDAIASKAPYRKRAYLQLSRILFAVTGDWHWTFLDRLFGPIVLWVMDLPASESNHHAYRYGLLDHLLEVTLATVIHRGNAVRPEAPMDSEDPLDGGQVLRLSIALGLLHDIGKVLGVEVRDETSGELWDPFKEPLAYFKVRNKIPLFTPTRFQFLEHRGLHGHEEKGRELLPHILPRFLWKKMGQALTAVYDSYLERFSPNRIEREAPSDYVASIVQQGDEETARQARSKGWTPKDTFQKLMVTAARVPWKRIKPKARSTPAESGLGPVFVREPESTC
jgi:hypothetical protein